MLAALVLPPPAGIVPRMLNERKALRLKRHFKRPALQRAFRPPRASSARRFAWMALRKGGPGREQVVAIAAWRAPWRFGACGRGEESGRCTTTPRPDGNLVPLQRLADGCERHHRVVKRSCHSDCAS